MAINQERYEEYRREINQHLEGLSYSQRFGQLRARIIDVMGKRNVRPGETLRMKRLIRQFLEDDVVPHLFDSIFEEYEDIIEIVNLHYDDLGVDISRDFERLRAYELTTRQEIGDYQETVERLIHQATREGLVKGDSVGELSRRIGQAGEKASRYAQTLAKTQLKTAGRVAKAEKARRAGVEYFEYVGIVRSSTRPFCRAMVGTTHSAENIRRMRNGNREPVIYHCGGWNCIHDWEPDPFAGEDDAHQGQLREVREGNSVIRLMADDGVMRQYQQAKELNREAARSN